MGHIPLISKRSLSLLLLSNLVCAAIGVHGTVVVDAEKQKLTGKRFKFITNHFDDTDIPVNLMRLSVCTVSTCCYCEPKVCIK